MVSWLMFSLVLRFHLRNGQSRRSVKSVGCSASGFQPIRLRWSQRILMNPGRATFPSIQKLHPSHSTRRLGAVFFVLGVCFWSCLFWCVVMHGMLKDLGCCNSVKAKFSIHIYFHCVYPAALCFSLQLCISYMLYSTVHVMHTICNLYTCT